MILMTLKSSFVFIPSMFTSTFSNWPMG
jgi:hypothetical protein